MVGHFLQVQDFDKSELLDIIELARILKHADHIGACPRLLEGAALGMITEEPWTQSQVTFELAMAKLGGHVVCLKPGQLQPSNIDAIAATSRILSRIVDVIELRAIKHEAVTALARYSSLPVINGLSDWNHPAGAMSDVMTMMEHAPAGKSLTELKLAFVGGDTNICLSLMLLSTRLGMHFTQVAPPKDQVSDSWQSVARENCTHSGGSLALNGDTLTGVKGADFIYIGQCSQPGSPDETADHFSTFQQNVQIEDSLMEDASTNARFLHPLHDSHPDEISHAGLNQRRSIIFDQAENRLHMAKSLLTWLVYPRRPRPVPERAAREHDTIRRFLASQHRT